MFHSVATLSCWFHVGEDDEDIYQDEFTACAFGGMLGVNDGKFGYKVGYKAWLIVASKLGSSALG